MKKREKILVRIIIFLLVFDILMAGTYVYNVGFPSIFAAKTKLNSCSDTDSGINIAVQGSVSGTYSGRRYTNTDSCISSATLTEYYCNNNLRQQTNIDCVLNGYSSCSSGKCTNPPSCTPATCTSLGKSCGSWSDNCGGTLNCGSCQTGYSCSNGVCIQQSTGNTYYVSNLGNDANTGKSETTPWKTIAKVNSFSFSPGDRILFKKGDTWNEQLTIPSSGSSDKRITFSSYGSGNLPIIQASGKNAISVYNKNYINIEDIEVKNSNYGVWIAGSSSNINIKRITSSFNYYDGLIFDGTSVSNILVEDTISHDNSRHGLLAHDSSNINVIRGKYYNHITQYGIGVGFDNVAIGLSDNVESYNNYYGIKTANAARNILIFNNTVYSNIEFGIDLDIGTLNSIVEKNKVYLTGKHGIVVEWYSKDNIVTKNIIHDNGKESFHAAIWVELANNTLVSYNTIYNEHRGIAFYTNSINSKAYNNILYSLTDIGFFAADKASYVTLKNNIAELTNIVVNIASDSQTGFVSNYNNWHSTGSKMVYSNNYLTFDSWKSTTGQDANSINSNPLFSSPPTNLHLQSTSPCINKGVNVGLTSDFDNYAVPSGTAPDIGAFEFH